VEAAENIHKRMFRKSRTGREKVEMAAGGAAVAALRAVQAFDHKRDKKNVFTANDLVHAAHDGNVELVLAVLGQPEKVGLVDINDYDDEGASAVISAFQFLLGLDEEFRVARKKRKERRTARLKKRIKKYEDLLHMLMRMGADLNAKEQLANASGNGADHEFTMLHYAAMFGNMSRIKWLVETVAVDIDVSDECGVTPLMLCCKNGFPKEAIYLMSWDVDPNVTDNEGRTALHYAALSGSVVLKVLLMSSANKSIRDMNGKTAADLCKERKKMISYNILETFELEHIAGKEYLDYLEESEIH